MADDWKPEGARELSADDWKPEGARALGAAPKGPAYGPTYEPSKDSSEREQRGFAYASGGTLGAAPAIVGAASAVPQGLANLLPKSLAQKWDIQQAPMGDAYRAARDDYRAGEDSAERANPRAYLERQILGNVVTSTALPELRAAKGAGLATRLGVTGLNAFGQGAINGANNSRADLTSGGMDALEKTGTDALKAGGAAAAGGMALHGAGAALGWGGGKLINGVAERSEGARRLMARGIRLTTGQQAPRSALNSLEETATSSPVFGDELKHTRMKAQGDWENSVFNEARAPGGHPAPTTGDINERLAAVHSEYGPAYDTIGKIPVAPVSEHGGQMMPLPEAMHAAAADPSVLATDADIGTVQRFLKNESSTVANQLGAGHQIDASVLMGMRSNVRAAARQATSSQNYAQAQLLRNAEEKITSSLDNQLPAAGRDLLRKVDGQYSKFKTVEDAVSRSGDQVSGLTPAKLSMAVKANTASKGIYSRGGGGALRELSRDGREVFSSVAPETGARGEKLPFHSSLAVAPAFNYLNESPRLQNAIFGETGAQHLAQGAVNAVSDELSKQRLLAAALRRLTPGAASEYEAQNVAQESP